MLQSGTMSLSERVMHVSNAPWLKCASIRDNILLGSSHDIKKYDRVVRACGLLVSERRRPCFACCLCFHVLPLKLMPFLPLALLQPTTLSLQLCMPSVHPLIQFEVGSL